MSNSSSGEFVLERNNGEHLTFGIGGGYEVGHEPVQVGGIAGDSEIYVPTVKTRIAG